MQLGIEHQVAERWVRVAEEVLVGVNGTLVERPIEVRPVAFVLVSVYQVVSKLNDRILYLDPRLGSGGEVEGRLAPSADVHEAFVEPDERVQDGALLHVAL